MCLGLKQLTTSEIRLKIQTQNTKARKFHVNYVFWNG